MKYAAVIITALVLFCSCGKSTQNSSSALSDVETAVLKARELADAAKKNADAMMSWIIKEDYKKAKDCFYKARSGYDESLSILNGLLANKKYVVSDETREEIKKIIEEISLNREDLTTSPGPCTWE